MNIIKYFNYVFAVVLIITAIFLAYIAVPFFGNKALIVKSGSMSPVIKTGDLVVVNFQNTVRSPQTLPIPLYKEGDLIAFKDQKNPSIVVTHRIVGKVVKNAKIFYQTKGDANNTKDIDLIPQESVLGKSIIVVPSLGKVFAAAKSKNGFLLLIIFPAFAVIFSESLNLYREITKVIKARKFLQDDPREKIESKKLIGPLGIRVLLPFVIGTMFFHNSFAFFTDSASSLNNTFTAASIFPSPSPSPSASPIATPSPSPSPSINSGDVVINEINWGGSSLSIADEWLELKNTTTTQIDISGWVVENLGSPNITIPASSFIPSKGFFLISNLNQSGSKVNVVPDLVTTAVSLLNTGEQLKLKTANAALIDTANQSSGAWFAGAGSSPGPAKSMERKSPPGDGTILSNWETAVTHTNMDGSTRSDEFGTPKAENGI